MINKRKKILLVTFSDRADLINFFKEDVDNDYYLLNYSNITKDSSGILFLKDSVNLSDHLFIGNWIKKLNPDRVVFFELSDIRLSFINIIITGLGYKTIFLDHGIREINSRRYVQSVELQNARASRSSLKLFPKHNTVFLFLEALRYLINNAKNRAILKYLLSFNKEYLFQHIVSLGNQFWRVILYCRNNLEVVSQEVKVDISSLYYTGFPGTDNYYSLPTRNNSDYIVFIDHPYLETNMYTAHQHKEIAMELKALAETKNTKLFIKLHPKTIPQNWLQYDMGNQIEILTTFPGPEFYLNAKLILSFSSTMLVSFLSKKKNVVLLSWYLERQHMGNDFSSLGVCHFSAQTQDLKIKYDYWLNNNLAERNITAWTNFIEEYNFPFDGMAGKRVIQLITS